MAEKSPPPRAPRDMKNVDLFEITSGGFSILSDDILRGPPRPEPMPAPAPAIDEEPPPEPPADLP